jgi:hypothetical protein
MHPWMLYVSVVGSLRGVVRACQCGQTPWRYSTSATKVPTRVYDAAAQYCAFLFFACAICNLCNSISTLLPSGLQLNALDVLTHTNRYARDGIPVIVTDATASWPIHGWTCDSIKKDFAGWKMRREYDGACVACVASSAPQARVKAVHAAC